MPGRGNCAPGSRPLRIEANTRSGSVANRNGIGRSAGGASFLIEPEAGQPRAAAAQASVASSGIEALLALQSVDDPLFAKKKAVRRGNALLAQMRGKK